MHGHSHPTLKTWVLALLGCILWVSGSCGLQLQPTRIFTIQNNTFVRDGKTVQLISGSVHYFRIHPAYWRDRLVRLKAMGLNAIQTYVAWNVHEPYPGQYEWTGGADLVRFLEIAHDLDLLVLLRPGPYICAEWEFGGFPWWLASSQVTGGQTLRLRSDDRAYLAHVDRWWRQLLPRMAPLLYARGGPIVMVQVENEFGYVGTNRPYIAHLAATARGILGRDVIIYTTDSPWLAEQGSIYGDDVYTVVDFGPATNFTWAFQMQARMNTAGNSPPLCSEFYTGWISYWQQPVANTSSNELVDAFAGILAFANGTGSLNFYMAHGGTNFGYAAGPGVITSYDYDAPVSEAGDYGQPGIGGGNKFEMIRQAIAAHTGKSPAPVPPRPALASYGAVVLSQQAVLLDVLPELSPGDGVPSRVPKNMEEYGLRSGLIVYSKQLPLGALSRPALLELGTGPRDFAQVLLNGKEVGIIQRDQDRPALVLPALGSRVIGVLDIVVEPMGRSNWGTEWDLKGIVSDVTLDGATLYDWRVFPIDLDTVLPLVPFAFRSPQEPARDSDSASRSQGPESASVSDAHLVKKQSRELLGEASWSGGPLGADNGGEWADTADLAITEGPKFFKGTFYVDPELRSNGSEHLPDSFLSTRGWGKGLAWVNGFNLGRYWPIAGPQMTLYVPGPVLKPGPNELVLLELWAAPADASTYFVMVPDFSGPTPALEAGLEGQTSNGRSIMLRAVAEEYGRHLRKRVPPGGFH